MPKSNTGFADLANALAKQYEGDVGRKKASKKAAPKHAKSNTEEEDKARIQGPAGTPQPKEFNYDKASKAEKADFDHKTRIYRNTEK